MSAEESPRRISSAMILALRDHWIEACGARAMAERADIDPLKMPKLLPHVVLTEVHQKPLRFRYRLIGTWVTEMSGRDVTGRWLDEEIYGNNTERMLWAYHKCVDQRTPVAVREQVQFTAKEWIVIEALLLPLGNDVDGVTMILSGVDDVANSVEKPPEGSRYTLDWQAP